jgi:hypothetical protein
MDSEYRTDLGPNVDMEGVQTHTINEEVVHKEAREDTVLLQHTEEVVNNTMLLRWDEMILRVRRH